MYKKYCYSIVTTEFSRSESPLRNSERDPRVFKKETLWRKNQKILENAMIKINFALWVGVITIPLE